MQKLIFLLKVLTLTFFICSCGVIRGKISDSDQKVIECKQRQFLLKENAPLLPTGSKCTVKPTRNRKKANVTEIKH